MLSKKTTEQLEAMDKVNLELGFDPYDPNANQEQYIGQVLEYAEHTYTDLKLSLEELRAAYLSNGKIVKKVALSNMKLMLFLPLLNTVKIVLMNNENLTSRERDLESKIDDLHRKIHFLINNFKGNVDCIEVLADRIKYLTLKSEYIDKILREYEKEELVYNRKRVLSKEIG